MRTDVESVRTGSGDDNINIMDGAAGAATCGGGTDVVTADADDDIGSGCEAGGVTPVVDMQAGFARLRRCRRAAR